MVSFSFSAFCKVVAANSDVATEEEMKAVYGQGAKFMKYAPHFAGPTPVEVAIEQMLSVIEKASVEGGNGGTAVSQFGNKQWL
jgi:hypothetical protein